MPDSRTLRDIGTRLSDDTEWLHATVELEARVAARAAKLAGAGLVISLAFAVLALVSASGGEASPAMLLSLNSSTAIGALAVLITSSTLLTTIAVTIATRIRDHEDKEFAQFVKPISFAASSIAIFAPPITLSSIFSSAPFRLDIPLLVITVVSIGFICLMSALTMELLELGSKLDKARAEIVATAKRERRDRAAQRLATSATCANRPVVENFIALHGVGCVAFGAVVYFIHSHLEIADARAPSVILGAISTSTMAIILLATYKGQLELRRGNLADSTLAFLASIIWLLSVLLAGLGSQYLAVQFIITGTVVIGGLIPTLLFTRLVAKTKFLSALSLRRAVSWRLLRDAEINSPVSEDFPINTSNRLLKWYAAVSGASARDVSAD